VKFTEQLEIRDWHTVAEPFPIYRVTDAQGEFIIPSEEGKFSKVSELVMVKETEDFL
jgi:hypothetical protein